MPVLNDADKLCIGSNLATAAYLGATKVWPKASAAVTIKSVATANNSGSAPYSTTVVSAETSATQVGDVVLFLAGNNNYGTAEITTTVVTGNPTVHQVFNYSPATTGNATVAAFWYVANTAGPQTITVSGPPGTDSKSVTVYVLGGANPTAPVNVFATGGSTTTTKSWVCPSITTTAANALVITHVGCSTGFQTTTVTTPAPLHQDVNTTPPSDNTYLYAEGSVLRPTAGATGTYTYTASLAKPYVSATLAIAPA